MDNIVNNGPNLLKYINNFPGERWHEVWQVQLLWKELQERVSKK